MVSGTARVLLNRLDVPLVPEDEVGDEGAPDDAAPPDPEEIALLREVERNLEAVVAGGDIDPKVQVVLHYLRDRQWLERRCHIAVRRARENYALRIFKPPRRPHAMCSSPQRGSYAGKSVTA